MSPVSIGLDLLLAVLLVAALAVGLRLNAKLKMLREGQSVFVKAVGELDQAAMRAEAGLASLRTATLEAHDHLVTRIETARTLSARLDRASEDAEAASAKLEAASQRAEAVAEAPPPRPAPPPLRLVEPADRPVSSPRLPRVDAPDTRSPRMASPPTETPAEPTDRLARFVARRRGARP